MGVQNTYVNPGVAAAELRALACCAHDCDEPVSLPGARKCCGLTLAASGPAELRVAQDVGCPLVMGPPVARTTVASTRAERIAPDALQVAGTGPPTFLEQRHLLL